MELTADSQHSSPTHTLLHISDTHFVEDDALLHGSVDSDSHLAQMFEQLKDSAITPDALIFTGDLADAGQPQAYQRLRALVEPVCEHYDAELIWVMGNHDSRPEFRRGLWSQDPGTEAAQAPVDYVREVNGLRIIALDSTVPGHHHGEITDEQYVWLQEVLEKPAEHGSLLALHHPPIPSPLDLLELVELRNQSRLEDALAGSDVRGVLAGHLHYSTTSTLPAGIPVSVASATCYTQDLRVQKWHARGQNGGQGCNLVEVYPDRVVHTVVPMAVHPTVYEMTPEMLQSFIDKSRQAAAAAEHTDHAGV
ncbi:metallophosphoesterase [Nesterenkonia flava]|uniref:Metallophosphoesterase n=1 Tax=Nesterenkonia flava TaxID=469799 RepID=A0ABU1FTV0_9MICC|nr:metallophosphoesterase [Nesterenkonia flava]MDR5711581.1 metallophosphoesterase [Nesterenkonia flava]